MIIILGSIFIGLMVLGVFYVNYIYWRDYRKMSIEERSIFNKEIQKDLQQW